MNNSDAEQKIIKAFKASRFRWRTIRSVAKEVKLPPNLVRKIIMTGSIHFVRASTPNKNGEAIFALREIYRMHVNPLRRIFAAFKNRGD